ncbi:MAG: TraB/GumN family protein [Betaproteobacteria bacterium]
MIRRQLVSLLALLCATTASQAPATAQSGTGQALLWEARSATATVYLLGTIHLGTRELYPLPASVEAAYRRAAVVALEADPADPSALLLAGQAMMYVPPDGLERNVPAALVRDTTEVLARYGLPAEMTRMMKPFVLAMTISVLEAGKAGLDASLGIDAHLASRARQDGKRLVELESMAMQLGLMDGLPRDAQAAMGDLRSLPAPARKALQERLFDQRNRAMADKVAAMLGSGDVVLVGVGAAHLMGATGLVELLRARGYSVRRL